MTSKELMYVKTIAEEKTISKAAQKLFVAQPSLSQSLQRIEEALGARLFNRTAGGLTLTYAGERYYHMAVSYTHLDVYKRQPPFQSTTPFSHVPSSRLHPLAE